MIGITKGDGVMRGETVRIVSRRIGASVEEFPQVGDTARVRGALEDGHVLLEWHGKYVLGEPHYLAKVHAIPPAPITAGLRKLVFGCTNCGGYARKAPIALPGEFDDDGRCKICGPVRDWLWENYRMDIEAFA